jgi:hypothetical protein
MRTISVQRQAQHRNNGNQFFENVLNLGARKRNITLTNVGLGNEEVPSARKNISIASIFFEKALGTVRMR